MRYMGMLFIMTAMVVMTAGSTRGNTSPGPPTLGSSAAASAMSSLSVMKGDDSSNQTIFAAVQNSTVGRLFASASLDDKGCDKDGHSLSFDSKHCPPPPPPPPRSKRCPPSGKDHDRDSDDRDDRCGKGDDGNNP